MTEYELRQSVIQCASAYVGISKKGDPLHIELIDYYNSHIQPLPRGHKMSYTDSYCACACTSWFDMAGLLHLIYPECGVQEMIQGCIAKKCWVEDDNYIPNPGDLITFNWDGQDDKENTGYGQHVALVEYVTDGNIINLINPNTSGGKTLRSCVNVGTKSIRGFITPDYEKCADEEGKKQYVTLKKVYLKTTPNMESENCCIKLDDDLGVRDYISSSDLFEIVDQNQEWYKIKVVGDHEWYPWVYRDQIEVKQL